MQAFQLLGVPFALARGGPLFRKQHFSAADRFSLLAEASAAPKIPFALFSGGSADGAAAEVAGGHRKHVFEGAREVALVLETDHVANIGHRQLLLGSEKFLRLLETTARDVAPR